MPTLVLFVKVLYKVASTFLNKCQFVGAHPKVCHHGVLDPVRDLRPLLLTRLLETDLAAGAALGLRTHFVPPRFTSAATVILSEAGSSEALAEPALGSPLPPFGVVPPLKHAFKITMRPSPINTCACETSKSDTGASHSGGKNGKNRSPKERQIFHFDGSKQSALL